MDFVGIDSRKFIRNGKVRDFIALMGICVIVEDYNKFKEDYCKIVKSLFEKRKMQYFN